MPLLELSENALSDGLWVGDRESWVSHRKNKPPEGRGPGTCNRSRRQRRSRSGRSCKRVVLGGGLIADGMVAGGGGFSGLQLVAAT